MEILITAKDKATRVLRRITGSIKKWGVGAVKIAGGVVAGLGLVTGALTFLMRKVAGSIDQQAKVAAKLGITNAALSTFHDSARYAGITTETFNMALQRMVRRVAEAANGTGEAKDALIELGLNAKTLNQTSPDKALKEIINALDGVKNQSDKVRLAFKLFDSEGVSMVNMTKKGLQQAQNDAATLGIKLSEAQAKGVEAANDAFTRVKGVFTNFIEFVTATLAPQVKAGLDGVFNWIKKQDLKLWANKTALGITVAFQATVAVLGLVAEGVIAITRGLNAAVDVVNKLTRASMMLMLKNAKEDLAGINKEIAEIENSEGWGWNERNEELAALKGRKTTREEGIASTEGSLASAAEIDAKADRIEALLKEVQGFSSSTAINNVMKKLEATIKELEGKHEETKTKAVEAGESIKYAAAGSAEALALVGTQAERINAALEKMSGKEWVVNVKGIERFEVGGVDMLARALEEGADK